MIDEEHNEQFRRLEDMIEKMVTKTKKQDVSSQDIATALTARNTYVDENFIRVEVKVARVEEKIDGNAEKIVSLRERVDETNNAIIKLIEEHAKADSDRFAAQLEQNRLLLERIEKVDDFRKKLQYGALGVMGLFGIIWGAFKLALMTLTGSK